MVALHSANTGIVDYGVVTKSFGKVFQGHGGVIINNFEVHLSLTVTFKIIADYTRGFSEIMVKIFETRVLRIFYLL